MRTEVVAQPLGDRRVVPRGPSHVVVGQRACKDRGSHAGLDSSGHDARRQASLYSASFGAMDGAAIRDTRPASAEYSWRMFSSSLALMMQPSRQIFAQSATLMFQPNSTPPVPAISSKPWE